MSGFTTHQEIHDAPAGYRVLRQVTIPLAGEDRTIRAADWLALCPWLGDGEPGHHTAAMGLSNAILKFIVVFLPDATTDDNFQMGEDSTNLIPDRGGLLRMSWPFTARKVTWYWKATTAPVVAYVELWFDIPVPLSPPTA